LSGTDFTSDTDFSGTDLAGLRDLFASLRRKSPGGAFHVPFADAPDHISSWHSAHHALALRHLDPAAAAEELAAVYAACQLPNGLVLRDRQLDSQAEPVPLIAPPVAAYAAARMSLESPTPLEDLVKAATRQLDAIWSERLPPDTSLPVILHPAESGVDASPLYASVVESTARDEWDEELSNLARSASACDWDPDKALRAGHAFVVEDPLFCGFLQIALEEVGAACDVLGDDASSRKLKIRSQLISAAISERLWWEQEEIFAGYDRQRDAPLLEVTAAGLVPAASRVLLEDGVARRAISRHLRPSGSSLWSRRGIQFRRSAGEGDNGADGRPWSGPLISGVGQYWAHLALVRAGRVADARTARSQLEDLVSEQGMREYYDPTSGKGVGGGADGGCTAPALMLEMRAQEI